MVAPCNAGRFATAHYSLPAVDPPVSFTNPSAVASGLSLAAGRRFLSQGAVFRVGEVDLSRIEGPGGGQVRDPDRTGHESYR